MRALFASALLLVGVAGLAVPPRTDAVTDATRTTESRTEQTAVRPSTDVALEERLAREWGLKPEEWARYRQVMKGPLGVYSPNLDPLTALGIEARSDEERRRYAELQVRMEGHRVEKLLAYERAYAEAWKRLYPNLQPVTFSTPADPAQTGRTDSKRTDGRVAVFVKDNCGPCDQRVKQLQAAGHAFDIYVIGTQQDDARIRQWAARVGIDSVRVRARAITLNHDAGRWLSIGGQGELPAVVREINGRWRRE